MCPNPSTINTDADADAPSLPSATISTLRFDSPATPPLLSIHRPSDTDTHLILKTYRRMS
ncbi:hypothetical protein Alg130_11369 [Pyrenophora tritici-repentis]|uniref:Uncharacterized protein n=1 Tax=Pyrenophora tritici-repentis TaxID=45151 RepID=A0A834S5D5_9PLEO|nr:hypothetical protein A1F99_001510 [Pyrenophora tritici-repentis]KAF7575925.1 hypothetical protein PtrM4_001650 [Pyrenophora tritici-repentis]KAI0569355.1 hypothetical protein Alg215_11686 [Pyrenophora tritici-repentis]KAI0570068.1 hypothetical protein Alg130_11369 [Pyrenophora tritici-repentis]KAI0604428.1 hypothetical protein TUN205_11326 [Pyrenophora tritici-repentis]